MFTQRRAVVQSRAGLIPLIRKDVKVSKASVPPANQNNITTAQAATPLGGQNKPALVLDFDETLSKKDTVETAVNAATRCILNSHGHDAAKEHMQLVQSLVQQYQEEEATVLGYESLHDSVFRSGAIGLADTVDDFSERMYPLLASALKGVTQEALACAGSSVQLSDGALRLLAAARARGCTVRVASSNPSTTLIEAALSREHDFSVLDELKADKRFMPEVLASELAFTGPNGEATEGFSRLARSGRDKLELGFRDLDPVVYVGDSLGDLRPMLHASYPVVLGPRSKLHDALERLDVDAYTADSLDEVLHAFFMPHPIKENSLLTSSVDTDTEAASAEQQPSTERTRVPVIVAAAGSDSGGGAGIQADTKAGTECGVHVSTAVTAVTVQDSRGVYDVHTVPLETIDAQLRAVLEDFQPDCVKTGMVPSGDIAFNIAKNLMELCPSAQLVVDPVLVAATGDRLVPQAEIAKIKQALVPLASCATPNGAEAQVLLDGIMPAPESNSSSDSTNESSNADEYEQSDVHSRSQQGETSDENSDFLITSKADRGVKQGTARELLMLGCRSVVLKGGDAAASTGEATSSAPVIDYFAVEKSMPAALYGSSHTESANITSLPDATIYALKSRPVHATNAHGTGCALASSIAAHLSRGFPMKQAVRFSKRYVQGALEASTGASVGKGLSKPMNFAYRIFDWQDVPEVKRIGDLRLCAITDESLDRKHGRTVRQSVTSAIKGGATVVQVRWKSGGAVDCINAVKEALDAARGTSVPIIVNDRVDVALACNADGVHVGQEDVVASDVRRLIGPSMLLGVSARTEEEIIAAARAGADYVGSGPVFDSPTKPDRRKLGTERLNALSQSSPIPVMAIGGVDASNVGAVVTEGGVESVAVISGIYDTPAPASAAHSVRTALDSALTRSVDEEE